MAHLHWVSWLKLFKVKEECKVCSQVAFEELDSSVAHNWEVSKTFNHCADQSVGADLDGA